jgi:hypothetical protein
MHQPGMPRRVEQSEAAPLTPSEPHAKRHHACQPSDTCEIVNTKPPLVCEQGRQGRAPLDGAHLRRRCGRPRGGAQEFPVAAKLVPIVKVLPVVRVALAGVLLRHAARPLQRQRSRCLRRPLSIRVPALQPLSRHA